MTLEWISTNQGEWETPDGWWIRRDEWAEAWEYGFEDTAIGSAEFFADAKAECERMEGNSR